MWGIIALEIHATPLGRARMDESSAPHPDFARRSVHSSPNMRADGGGGACVRVCMCVCVGQGRGLLVFFEKPAPSVPMYCAVRRPRALCAVCGASAELVRGVCPPPPLSLFSPACAVLPLLTALQCEPTLYPGCTTPLFQGGHAGSKWANGWFWLPAIGSLDAGCDAGLTMTT